VPEIIVLDTDAKNLPDNDNWHTDVTFIETPPMGALLPPSGGDTLGIAAFESLSEPLKRMLGGLTAEHDMVKSFPAHRFARTPDERVRWRWKLHDLAFWDNRLTQHYAIADYLPHRRVMHRATVLGDQPF
jgi:alpha-ketoglutarate-dependent taurine dioxygenase